MKQQTLNIDWHRAFGMAIKSCVSRWGYHVETEIDVSQQKQLLDLIIIKLHQNSTKQDELSTGLCDGLENMSRYNLISYKSFHESFNRFAVEELYSYYVNYSKLPEQRALKLSSKDYQLYGIATKLPEKLLKSVNHRSTKAGVYDLNTGLKPVRLLVLNELAQIEANAILNLFSNRPEQFKYGYEHIDKQRFNTQNLPILNRIIALYKLEGVPMPYTEEQFLEDYLRSVSDRMTPEELLERVKPQKILAGLKPEERLMGLKPEERLVGLKPEEILACLKPDQLKELEQCLHNLKK